MSEQLQFDKDGAEILRGAVSASVIGEVIDAFGDTIDGRPGVRSLQVPAEIVRIVAAAGPLGRIAQSFRPDDAAAMEPVRIVFFDKTPETNWGVPWHQDRTIAVKARHDVVGFSNWNTKDGVAHVEPPIDLLMRMVTLRLHLDDAGIDNGALDIVPGSHSLGRIPAAEVIDVAKRVPSVRCTAKAGDVLAMRLVTLHRSERLINPSRRRVLHVDFSPDRLPPPLAWNQQ
ncbi:phytanoyl-CoA dioxygenase family protein [Mesorhizobium sp. CGMCC 1.15528]|uniref:Phytanoyl-CoA dioxygenase family protein n=1 Tax=Mesorhizobium zhangyense TaxID=1776730 RepID=A0A7C9RB79_9HYPH|nr:phytanoyl-CoA dioxygenase family protein [Mesorhizobium zhangyense]NGN44337.1 phytanoyl-CoA dioxygenase family protein [Mesorhizobium zhangyense]